MKAIKHLEVMQKQVVRYLIPEPYVPLLNYPVGHDFTDDQLFINDMIYMLDGPEQREAMQGETP